MFRVDTKSELRHTVAENLRDRRRRRRSLAYARYFASLLGMRGLFSILATAVLVASAAGCASTTQRDGLPPLEAVDHVDLPRYLGTWYDIASYPQWFQKGCTATTATYAMRDDGLISVVNTCRKGGLDGKLDVAEGRARVVDTATNAKLEVSFFGPFWGDYWIIQLDEDYRWAVVGHPGRDYLWILSRTRQMDEETYAAIEARLREQHYDTSRLVETLQPAGE